MHGFQKTEAINPSQALQILNRFSKVEDVALLPDAEFVDFCSAVLELVIDGLAELGYETVPTNPAVKILDPKSRCGGINSWKRGEEQRVISISKVNQASPAAVINVVAHEAIHSTVKCRDSGESHRLGFMEISGALNRAFGLRVASCYWRDNDAKLPHGYAAILADTRNDEIYAAEHFGDCVTLEGEEHVLVGFHGKRVKDSEATLLRLRDGKRVHISTTTLLDKAGWMSRAKRNDAFRRYCIQITDDKRLLLYGGHLYEAHEITEWKHGPLVRLKLVQRNPELKRTRPRESRCVNPRSLATRMGQRLALWPRQYVAPTMPDHPLAKLVAGFFGPIDSLLPSSPPPSNLSPNDRIESMYRVVLEKCTIDPAAMVRVIHSTRAGRKVGGRYKCIRLVNNVPSPLLETSRIDEADSLARCINASGSKAVIEVTTSDGQNRGFLSNAQIEQLYHVRVTSAVESSFALEILEHDIEYLGVDCEPPNTSTSFVLARCLTKQAASSLAERLEAACIKAEIEHTD